MSYLAEKPFMTIICNIGDQHRLIRGSVAMVGEKYSKILKEIWTRKFTIHQIGKQQKNPKEEISVGKFIRNLNQEILPATKQENNGKFQKEESTMLFLAIQQIYRQESLFQGKNWLYIAPPVQHPYCSSVGHEINFMYKV